MNSNLFDNQKIMCWRRWIVLGLLLFIFILNLNSCKEKNIVFYFTTVFFIFAIICIFFIMKTDNDSNNACGNSIKPGQI
jgi:hypothetical protein